VIHAEWKLRHLIFNTMKERSLNHNIRDNSKQKRILHQTRALPNRIANSNDKKYTQLKAGHRQEGVQY
jgi:hypothetical protein